MSVEDPLLFVKKKFTDGILCKHNHIGEDPHHGFAKACYILSDEVTQESADSESSETEESDSEHAWLTDVYQGCEPEDLITTKLDCWAAFDDLIAQGVM
jgi:hypothetical protein